MRARALGRSLADATADAARLARGSSPRLVALGVLLGALLAGAAPCAAQTEPDMSWLDRAALDRDEVQVLAEPNDHGVVHMRFAIKVAAPAQAIWQVLKACELSPEYVPTVVSCHSIEKVDGDRAELFVQTVKPAFFIPSFEHVFRLDYEPYTHIGVHRVSGPLAQLDGNWWLVPQPDASILLIHELAVDPGLPIPRFFVRATMKRDVPKILLGVRDRAQARR
jgi:hypothetical protein